MGAYSGGVDQTGDSVATAPEASFLVDSRPRWRRMLPVVGTGALSIGALGYLRFVDPNTPGHYPGCPSQSLLGLDCPGCGGMRGTYDLLHGDIAGMLDDNILLIVFWPVALIAFGVWAYRAWTGRRPAPNIEKSMRQNRVLVTILIITLVFGVVRNFVPYLGSGPG